jgi:iron complex outermembrane receptor protein
MLFALGVGALGAAARAEVQPPLSNALSEVIVTAQKRAENVEDVPLSIVAKSGPQLLLAGATNLVSLQRIVPDLGLTSTAQYAGTAIRMRGFGASSNSGIDPDVAPYLDGVYIARPGAVMTSFLDVASVEVLRGPQGTLFGRNAVVGAISLHTNPPVFDHAGGSLTAQVGTYGERRVDLIGNVPVGGSFALRAAGFTEHTDGYISDRLSGRIYGAQDTFAGRLSARAAIASSLSWLGRVDYAQTTGDGVNATPVDTATASPVQLAAFIQHLGGVANAPNLSPTLGFDVHQRFDTGLNDRQLGLTSDLTWSPGGFTVHLINAYRRWANTQTDGDYGLTALDLLSRYDSYLSNSQSHELQVASPQNEWLGGRLNAVAGLYYFEEDYRITEAFSLGSQYCDFIAASKPALLTPCLAGSQKNATRGSFHQWAQSVAGYAQVDYKLMSGLTLTLGVRDTADRKTGSFLEQVSNPGAGVVRAAESDPRLGISANRPTSRANLTWVPRAGLMAFASYSTGYKSGGLNSSGGASALSPARRIFQPETSEDYELGVKLISRHRGLLFNADLFQTQIHAFQDRSFDGLGYIIRNAGNVRARGAEVEAEAALPYGFRLEGSAAYLDSIYTQNISAPGLPGCTGQATSCPTVQNLSGRPNYYAPRWQSNVALNHATPTLPGGWSAQARIDVTYVDSMYTTNDDNPQGLIKARLLLGARVDLYSPERRWRLSVFGENLSNQHYYTTKFAQALDSLLGVRVPVTGATLMRGYLGAPLTAGVSLSAAF